MKKKNTKAIATSTAEAKGAQCEAVVLALSAKSVSTTALHVRSLFDLLEDAEEALTVAVGLVTCELADETNDGDLQRARDLLVQARASAQSALGELGIIGLTKPTDDELRRAATARAEASSHA